MYVMGCTYAMLCTTVVLWMYVGCVSMFCMYVCKKAVYSNCEFHKRYDTSDCYVCMYVMYLVVVLYV